MGQNGSSSYAAVGSAYVGHEMLFGKMLRYFNVNDVVIRAKSQFNTNCCTDLSIQALAKAVQTIQSM